VKDPGTLRVQTERPRLTPRIDLPGRQERLRQMILYVAQKCASAERMGLVKLNKILWKADFDAFAARGIPVTGRAYQRLELGPAPREMRPLLDKMIASGLIHLEETDFGDGVIEYRPIVDAPKITTSLFDDDDISFVDAAITHYWNMTGKETSDDSHGIAWKSRKNGEPMFYELSLIADIPLSTSQIIDISRVMRSKNGVSAAARWREGSYLPKNLMSRRKGSVAFL
jgi:hypothetical protein